MVFLLPQSILTYERLRRDFYQSGQQGKIFPVKFPKQTRCNISNSSFRPATFPKIFQIDAIFPQIDAIFPKIDAMCTDRQTDRHLDMQRGPLHSLIQGRLKKGLNRHTHTNFQMLIVESYLTMYGKSNYIMKMQLEYSLFVYINITYYYSPCNIHYTNNYFFQKSNGNLEFFSCFILNVKVALPIFLFSFARIVIVENRPYSFCLQMNSLGLLV